MKIRSLHIIILIALATNYACLEPSDIGLYEEGEPELVVEARIDDQDPPHYFRISKSVNPESLSNSLPINNAQILIKDNLGNEKGLSFIGQGLYRLDEFKGMVGRIYTIDVDINNTIYTAIDSMRTAPKIDSLKSEFIDEPNREKGYYLVFYINDKNVNQNYYKFEVTVNDSLYNGYYDLLFVEDILGQTTQTWVLPYNFNRNDTVITTVHSITQTMFEYYRGLNKQVDILYGNIQAPNLNPPNNIKSALGYFQASSVWTDTTLIQ